MLYVYLIEAKFGKPKKSYGYSRTVLRQSLYFVTLPKHLPYNMATATTVTVTPCIYRARSTKQCIAL